MAGTVCKPCVLPVPSWRGFCGTNFCCLLMVLSIRKQLVLYLLKPDRLCEGGSQFANGISTWKEGGSNRMVRRKQLFKSLLATEAYLN